MIKTKITNDKMIIEVDLQAGHPSKSGKTLLVATTNGFLATGETFKGKSVSLSLNVTVPKG